MLNFPPTSALLGTGKIKKHAVHALAALGAIAILYWLFIFLYKEPPVILQREGFTAPDVVGFSVGAPAVFESFDSVGNRTQKNVSGSGAPATQRKVIKNGALDLLVKDAEETTEQIKALASTTGGFVEEANVYEVSDDTKAARIIIRVPANKFDLALAAIKNLAVEVDRETINVGDVTDQFVDFEARLKNLRAEEEQLRLVLREAKKIEDILKVREVLSSVRGQIEQIEGQLQYLSRQVDMSTITANLTAEADVEVFGIRWRPLTVAKQGFRQMLVGLTDFVDKLIILAFQLPVILLWLLVLALVLWVLWRIILKAQNFISRK